MKTKADKHREAGTLDQFRARQAVSRASEDRRRDRVQSEPPSTTQDDLAVLLREVLEDASVEDDLRSRIDAALDNM